MRIEEMWVLEKVFEGYRLRPVYFDDGMFLYWGQRIHNDVLLVKFIQSLPILYNVDEKTSVYHLDEEARAWFIRALTVTDKYKLGVFEALLPSNFDADADVWSFNPRRTSFMWLYSGSAVYQDVNCRSHELPLDITSKDVASRARRVTRMWADEEQVTFVLDEDLTALMTLYFPEIE